MKSKISVIVPVYNTERYLAPCLDSILSQTLSEIEVICINDGSPDNSLALLREYEKRDSRVKIINKRNEGVGAARNDGIKAAQGEFTMFMDSDDFYPHARVLERLYNTAAEYSVAVCGGCYQQVTTDGTILERTPTEKGLSFSCEGLTSYREFQYDYGYWSYLFSTALLKENGILFPRYSRFQDPPFFVRAMIAADTFYAFNEPVYCYRILPSEEKYTSKKTRDTLCGILDNLRISRAQELAKLHYLTACRLNEEGSYMAMQNIGVGGADRELLAQLLHTTAAVDTAWLRAQGFALPEPFVPEVFIFMAEQTGRYAALRKNKLARAVTWLPRRLFR